MYISSKEFIINLEREGQDYYWSAKNLMIICPFHADSAPSLGINFNKNMYNCLGCGAKGYADDLAKILFGNEIITENDIEEDLELEGKSHSEITKMLDRIKKIRYEDKSIKIKVLKNFYPEEYPIPHGRYERYLKSRQINKIMFQRFNIRCGYFKGDERIIIPVKDEYNRIIYIYSRSINTDSKKLKVRKSEDSDASKVLFGLREALKHNLIKNGIGVIVEGEIDSIWLQQNKLPAVALGKKIPSEIQLYKMAKTFDRVYLSLDGDVNKTELISAKREISNYVPCSVINLPLKKDPNNLVKSEVEKIYLPVYKGLGGNYV